ncbi:Biotin synthesis protein BioC [hydrothermal vent metagenome]|uniref:Biotin synthesis protein BioC n=1 Tax=hydrothermal vent metagenome TaxID=652676 RepID=A0A1W1BSE6_9ZZZZ
MLKAINEFSRFAQQYNQYNIIQTEVARNLIAGIPENYYQNIIDIGCGSGAVYHHLQKQNISYNTFIAVDSSKEMLAIHPNDIRVEKVYGDFNTQALYQRLPSRKEETLLISASALQWSKNLDFTFSQLSSLAKEAHFAIFTSGTFYSLHLAADIASPIYPAEELKEVINCYYNATYILKSYKLGFQTVRDMFQYIKKSGVSGGEKQLSYKQVKKLMEIYPLNYLEFEVLFVKATSLAK